MKTLIAGLLAAVGLVNTTDVHNPKEMNVPEIPPMVYMGEYVPIKIQYNETWAKMHPTKPAQKVRKKKK